MAELTVPRVDFSSLGDLPGIWKQNRQDQLRQQTLASLGQGTEVDSNALIRSGDLSLAQLGVAMRNRNADDAWRLQEATRAQKNADRSYSLQERAANRADDPTPSNFVKDEAAPGGYRPIGPATPEYLAQVAAAKSGATANEFAAGIERRKRVAVELGLQPGTPQYQQYVATETMSAPKAKDLPTSVVKDMNEKGGLLEDFTRIDNGFKDEYGGFKTAFAGDAANTIARNTGIGNEERAQWWQDYQNQKNIVRNKLFGSALTATEKAEFDKANIHPGMTPGAIRENLRLQRDAQRRATAKLVNAYSKMGYSQDQIEAATGFPLSEIQAPAAKPAGSSPKAGVVSYTDYFK